MICIKVTDLVIQIFLEKFFFFAKIFIHIYIYIFFGGLFSCRAPTGAITLNNKLYFVSFIYKNRIAKVMVSIIMSKIEKGG